MMTTASRATINIEEVIRYFLRLKRTFILNHDVLKQFAAFGGSRKCKSWEILDALEVSNDFKCVALVDKESLAFGRIVHFLCIFGDEGVEEGIKTLVIPTLGS